MLKQLSLGPWGNLYPCLKNDYFACVMFHPQTRKGDLLIFCFKENATSQQNPFNDFVLLLLFSQHFINMQCIKIYILNDLDTIKAVTLFTKYLSMLFTA